MIVGAIALLSLAVWAYLLIGRGWFWLCRERDDSAAAHASPPPLWGEGGRAVPRQEDHLRSPAGTATRVHPCDPPPLPAPAVGRPEGRPSLDGLSGAGAPPRIADSIHSQTAPGDAAGAWPSVVAIIPARDEGETIARSVGSLLAQDYPGPFSVIVVDDQSTDGTAAVARDAASEAQAAERLEVVAGNGPPPDWTGKLAAMAQGLAEVEARADEPAFVLFTDADIAYAPHVLTRLVTIARANGGVLTSLMVKLRCECAAERWLAPAFVFFFQMLYPFAWVNDPRRATAAAAGGCMLVKREALHAAGGLEAVRGALIDDCALAGLMKSQGPVWLGLTEDVDSLRGYPTLGDFRGMVARSAFAELRYSPRRLVGAIAGMALVYLAPPLLAIFARGWPQVAGLLVWAMMALAFAPILRLYRRPLLGGLALPAIAAAYVVFTLDSACQYWRGRGGYWKGRVQAPMRETRA